MSTEHRLTPQRCFIAVLLPALVFLSNGPSIGISQEHAADNAVTPIRRVPLTERQKGSLLLLNQSRPAEPTPLFLFTDPNKDPDDLSVLVLTKFLHDHRFISLRCVVTTLGDHDMRTKRAKFTRSVLDRLQLHEIPVGVGVDYRFEVRDASGSVDETATRGRFKDHAVFIETPLLDPLADVRSDGFSLLVENLKTVPDRSAVLLINCGMPDVAQLLEQEPDIVSRKVARMVIMGGIQKQLDDQGFVVADRRAYNNSTAQPAADAVYRRVQELQVPLTIVTREAAYSAAVSRSFYDGMAATGNPVGVYLEHQQKHSLEQLWHGIRTGTLPPALTPKWFFGTFTDIPVDSAEGIEILGTAEQGSDDFDRIWMRVSRFNLYDPLALLAATPGADRLLFRTNAPDGVKADVSVIGKESVTNPRLVRDLMSAMAIESLSPPLPPKSRTEIAPGYPKRLPVDESDAAWTRPLPNYDPPEYTADVVFRHTGDWADPKEVKDVRRRFVTQTASGEVAVLTDSRGRPLNPLGRTGLQGRGLLGRWGRNQAGDPLLTRTDPATGRLQVLVIERTDSGLKALPGGMADEGEAIAATVSRELLEETSASVSFDDAAVVFTGVVDDPRNTDNAWIETTVLHKHLSSAEDSAIVLKAGDDAKSVHWADINQELLSTMYASHGDYVRLALMKLRNSPALRQQVDDLPGP